MGLPGPRVSPEFRDHLGDGDQTCGGGGVSRRRVHVDDRDRHRRDVVSGQLHRPFAGGFVESHGSAASVRESHVDDLRTVLQFLIGADRRHAWQHPDPVDVDGICERDREPGGTGRSVTGFAAGRWLGPRRRPGGAPVQVDRKARTQPGSVVLRRVGRCPVGPDGGVRPGQSGRHPREGVVAKLPTPRSQLADPDDGDANRGEPADSVVPEGPCAPESRASAVVRPSHGPPELGTGTDAVADPTVPWLSFLRVHPVLRRRRSQQRCPAPAEPAPGRQDESAVRTPNRGLKVEVGGDQTMRVRIGRGRGDPAAASGTAGSCAGPAWQNRSETCLFGVAFAVGRDDGGLANRGVGDDRGYGLDPSEHHRTGGCRAKWHGVVGLRRRWKNGRLGGPCACCRWLLEWRDRCQRHPCCRRGGRRCRCRPCWRHLPSGRGTRPCAFVQRSPGRRRPQHNRGGRGSGCCCRRGDGRRGGWRSGGGRRGGGRRGGWQHRRCGSVCLRSCGCGRPGVRALGPAQVRAAAQAQIASVRVFLAAAHTDDHRCAPPGPAGSSHNPDSRRSVRNGSTPPARLSSRGSGSPASHFTGSTVTPFASTR